MVVLILVCIPAVIIAIAYGVMTLYPAFGKRASKEKLRGRSVSSQYEEGKFLNQTPTSMSMSLSTTYTTLRDFIKGNPNGRPKRPIRAELWQPHNGEGSRQSRITWLGHSALILELNGKLLLLDPMLGKSPSPFPLFGGKRYADRLPFEIGKLPRIDAVLISHDHYDHLDYGSIMRLKTKVGRFFVPLGVGAHLERWGVERERITECDWWEETALGDIALACTPARHFSGRSLLDRNAHLWCSWVIDGSETKIFFSGDSGYGPHFCEIGDKYGPFDLTLMECGQYDERWAAIHMKPEETVQAHLDVRGGVMIPIHWGAFTLAVHDWTDPVERAVRAAKAKDVVIATPRIGEAVPIGGPEYPSATWWR